MVVRPDHLGDLLFATPALAQIRVAFPDAHITGLVGPWGKAMWEGNPDLDTLQVVRFPGITANSGGGILGPYRLLRATARRLAAEKYDMGIVLRFDYWWGAALLAAAGVPTRWGYNTAGVETWLTNSTPYSPGKHEVEQNLALVDAVLAGEKVKPTRPIHTQVNRSKGIPQMRPPKGSEPTTGLLVEWLTADRRVVIHPGTAAANKLWTIEGWAEVASRLLADGWAVALTGAPNERILAEAIEQAIRKKSDNTNGCLVNAAGQTANLQQLVWILARATVVLGVDSGPLHIADALGRPSLHLYGPSDETIWGPWGNPHMHRAFRAPNTHSTMQLDVGSPELEGGPEMRAITPDMVMAEVRALVR